MLGREEAGTLTKKQKISDDGYEGGGGEVQNNYVLIDAVSSAGVSDGDTSHEADVAQEDGKCLKEEEEWLPRAISC